MGWSVSSESVLSDFRRPHCVVRSAGKVNEKSQKSWFLFLSVLAEL